MNKALLERLFNYKFNLIGQLEELTKPNQIFQADSSDYDVHQQKIKLKTQQLSMVESIIDLYIKPFEK